MKKPKHDITGKQFGYLVVDKMEFFETKKCFQAICHCLKCGKEGVIAEPCDIKSGHKKSCGCLAKYVKVDIIGNKYGHLEVTDMVKEFSKKINKFIYYVFCKCHNCGKENFKTKKQNVMNGSTTSCGCRRDFYKRGEDHVQFTGYREITGKKWSHYKKGAIKRNLIFDLKIEDVWSLYEQQKGLCALSGLEIVFDKGSHTTASLDRIDSNLGYTLSNVQWVHKDINKIKFNMPQDRFIELCHLVSGRMKNHV